MPSFVVFTSASQTFALPTAAVETILRTAGATPVPDGPPWLRGLLNVHGALIPVVDVAVRLGAPRRPPRPDQQLVLVASGGRRVALEVDRVIEIRDVPDAALAAVPDWAAGAGSVHSAATLPDGVVLVQSVEPWLAAAGEGTGAAP